MSAEGAAPGSGPLKFETPPALGPLYLRALFDRRPSRMPAGVHAPRLEASLEPQPVDAGRLAEYRRVCGFPPSAGLPLTFPHVLAAGLQLRMLAEPGFPVRLMGLVHVGNRIRQRRALRQDGSIGVSCWLEGSRSIGAGEAFCLHTTAADEAGVCWEEETHFIARGGGSGGPRGGLDRPAEAQWETVDRWSVPADTGRRYARVSGDYNPIHLTGVTGRLFGFRGAIAHGMWSLARCAAALGVAGDAATIDVRFQRPLVLPADVVLQRGATDDDFRLVSPDGGTVYLSGSTAAD